MAHLDHKDGSYHCLDCGRTAVPLDFHTSYEVEDFSMSKEDESPAPKEFLRVPIVPLNTAPLFTMGPLELPIGKVARVVKVRWNGGRLEPLEFSVPFADYQRALSGKRYNAHEMFLMDLSGICDGRPNFAALKKLIKHRYDIWLDLGIREIQDLYDSFAMDILWAVAGSLSCPSSGIYEEIFDLSDRCVPCAYIDREVRWEKEGAGPREVKRLLRKLNSIGFERVAVIDLTRLGDRNGFSRDLGTVLEGADCELMVGGGVRESDLDLMNEMGFTGALIDPFTPIIESIIEDDEAEAADAPAPSSGPATTERPETGPSPDLIRSKRAS